MTESDFSARLLQARVHCGLSQADLATIAGVAPAQISRYEAGKSRPRPVVVARLAHALRVAPDWLEHGLGENEVEAAVRFERHSDDEGELVVRGDSQIAGRLRAMASTAGITPAELLQKIIEAWERKLANEKPGALEEELAGLRRRVESLESASYGETQHARPAAVEHVSQPESAKASSAQAVPPKRRMTFGRGKAE